MLLQKYLYVLLVFMVISMASSGCWYRQCPIKGCKVKYEHSHGGRIVRGRGTFPKIHFFGSKSLSQKRDRTSNKRRQR